MTLPVAFSCTAIRSPEGMNRRMEEPMLPPAYYLDESDPDIFVLRRQDGTVVAAFSAQGGDQGRHHRGRLAKLQEPGGGPKPSDKGTAHDVEYS
jgi:hypothetical protein